jgi:predicted ferric reductase
MLGISLAGSVIALISLAGMIGRQNRHSGQVSSVSTTEAGVLDLQVTPGKDWPGHQAGQFALLTLDRKEGPHPFTIVSDWKTGAALRFAIKPLGDYTRSLPDRVKVGKSVTVEGPYGHFDFGDISEEQVWVAGGIGVAPFLARLEWLAARGGAKGKVHFFYSARTASEASFPAALEDLCWHAGVELHRHIDTVDGQVQHAEIGQFVHNISSVWFCGPATWARSLQANLQSHFGLPSGHFHRERFEFR